MLIATQAQSIVGSLTLVAPNYGSRNPQTDFHFHFILVLNQARIVMSLGDTFWPLNTQRDWERNCPRKYTYIYI